jgi:hypothetical protein
MTCRLTEKEGEGVGGEGEGEREAAYRMGLPAILKLGALLSGWSPVYFLSLMELPLLFLCVPFI